jgi:hypothetical protein
LGLLSVWKSIGKDPCVENMISRREFPGGIWNSLKRHLNDEATPGPPRKAIASVSFEARIKRELAISAFLHRESTQMSGQPTRSNMHFAERTAQDMQMLIWYIIGIST